MKQLWFGVLLLSVLLAVGLVSSFGIQWVQDPIASQLEQAAAAGISGDWEQADALFSAAQARWKTYRSLLSSVADHNPMEQIDSLFGELEMYKQAKQPVLFSALCKRLSQLTRAVGEAHSVSWGNLL